MPYGRGWFGLGRGWGMGRGWFGICRGFGWGKGWGMGRGLGWWNPYVSPYAGVYGAAAPYWQTLDAWQVPYPAYGAPRSMAYSGPAPASEAMSFAPQMTKEQEFDFLKNQADAIKGQLEQIEARVHDLESEE